MEWKEKDAGVQARDFHCSKRGWSEEEHGVEG